MKISCSLKYCDYQPFNIIWTKADDLDKWIPVNATNQISSSQKHFDLQNFTSYLTFTNISKLHEGLYRCELKLPQMSINSHYINVSVSDNYTGSEISCTELPEAEASGSGPWWLPYFSICMGVVILVIIVMLISIMCISGFKCSRKKVTQRVQVQNSEESLQHNHELLTLPPEQSTAHESDGVHDSLPNRKENQLPQVVYASLKDFIPTQSSTTSCNRTCEEYTVYASIRVS